MYSKDKYLIYKYIKLRFVKKIKFDQFIIYYDKRSQIIFNIIIKIDQTNLVGSLCCNWLRNVLL